MRIKTFTLSIFSIVIALTVLLTYSKGWSDTEVGGLIGQHANWTLDNSPYIAVGRLVVQEGVTLTIEPGVTVKFKPGTVLRADGTLVARGTQEKPITFTAFGEEEPGSWGGISFSTTSMPTELDITGNYVRGSILEHTIIEYAGSADNINAVVEILSSNLLVNHCTIRHNACCGIMIDSHGTTTIINSIIADNQNSCDFADGGGISIKDGDAIIANNTIAGNDAPWGSFCDGRGIYVATNGTVTISNNTINGNHSDDEGGGIHIERGTVTVDGNTIRENFTEDGGGGVYIGNGTVTIINNVIAGNVLDTPFVEPGSAIYIKSGKIQDLSNNIITGNTQEWRNDEGTSTVFIGSVPGRFRGNCIYNNKTRYDIYYDIKKGTDMDATGNYWGTTDEAKISMRIYDYLFDETKGLVNFVPFLTESPCGLQPPTGLKLTVLDASSVQLTWNANTEADVAGYKLYYDTDAGTPYAGKGAKEGDSPIDVKKLTSYTLSGLQTDATYYFVVTAYAKVESEYSNEVSSNSPPQTPSNLIPSDAATNISLMPTLEGSAFSDPDAGDSHKASQWQITTSAGDYANPVYDSGRNTTNKTKITVPAGKLSLNTTYYWRVRHQDSKGAWSDYSAETSFTTILNYGVGPHRLVLELSKGLNMISLPLKPDVSYTARSFAQKLGATLVIKFDLDEKKLERTFIPFIPVINVGDGFSLEGGKGYIVNVSEAKSVSFEGTAWGEEIPPSPPIISQRGTWAFVVVGFADNINVGAPGSNESTITVTNKRTHVQKTSPIGSIGQERFAVVFADLARRNVVEAGDEFQATVTDRFGNVIASQSLQRIDKSYIDKAYLTVNLRIGDMIPAKSALLQNYPNPFNPETWIPYQLSYAADVMIKINDQNGRLVRVLSLGEQNAGSYTSKLKAVYWDGRNENGEKVASGIYFYTLEAGNFRATRKLAVAK